MSIHIYHSGTRDFPWQTFYELMVHSAIITPQLEDGMRPLTLEELQASEGDPRRSIWVVCDNDVGLGFVMLEQQGMHLKELHTGWRAGSGELRMRVWELVRKKEFAAGAHTIIAIVPENNHRCRHMAVAIGFRRTGLLPKSFLQGGVMHDQILYSVTKDNV